MATHCVLKVLGTYLDGLACLLVGLGCGLVAVGVLHLLDLHRLGQGHVGCKAKREKRGEGSDTGGV